MAIQQSLEHRAVAGLPGLHIRKVGPHCSQYTHTRPVQVSPEPYWNRDVLCGVDLFSLPKVTVGKLALAWGWLRKPMIPLAFLFTFQSPFEGVKA